MARLSRRRALTIRIAVGTIAAMTAATVGVSAYAYHHLEHNIKTFTLEGVSPSRPAPATPAAPTAQAPINLLLIGSDSRANGNVALGGGTDVGGARSDTTILLHISGDRRHAVGVSIPRDSLVDVPPCESNGTWFPAETDVMFNSAFAEGGLPSGNPTCTQNTVEAMTGIRIDHTVVLDFTGFATMSSAVGGVTVCVPQVNDTLLEQSYGITLSPGVQALSGKSALEYVRAREGFGDNSDIGRLKRQQAFLSALAKKILTTGVYSDPVTLYKLANAATGALTVDPSLDSVTALEDLALEVKSVPLANIEFVTTPWRYDGARVDLVEPDTDVLWSLLRTDRTLEGADASGRTSPSTTTGATAGTTAAQGPGTDPAGGAPASAAAPASTSPAPDSPPRTGASASATSAPSAIPSGITQNIRPATTDLCSDLSYGQ
jgi:LCP family protein required for cell wall assembly